MTNWVLVVSGDDSFQKRSMAVLRGAPAVGAVSDRAARRLVGSLRPATVLVDGTDSYGRQFLASLRLLPEHLRPKALVVGGSSIGYDPVSSIEAALGATVAA